ncbi:MAG: hypothetical protein R2873_02565 [Caldilineaceae bacterium]
MSAPEGDGDGGRPKNYLPITTATASQSAGDRSHPQGALVIYEDNPAYGNLVGPRRVCHPQVRNSTSRYPPGRCTAPTAAIS